MALVTIAERFLDGRRLGFGDLHELLVEQPELSEAVWESLSRRHFTRRGLRQGLGLLPELRVELGRRLLGREPRVLDVLEVLQEVPELRELALEALRGGGFSPTQVMRVARRNPRLREAAVDAVLSGDGSREAVAELVERLPGSESLVSTWLERAGVPVEELRELSDVVAGSAEGGASGDGEGELSSSPSVAGALGAVVVAEGGGDAVDGGVAGAADEDDVAAMALIQAAQANPELVEQAVEAVLGEGPTAERVLALVNWLPGSESAIADRLGSLGLSDGAVEALIGATPELASEAWRVTREEWAGTEPPSVE